jgi:hypothetical protein
VSGPFAEGPQLYVNAHGTPKGTRPKISPPRVRVEHSKGIPNVQVLDAGVPVLDLACTDALNLAMLLIEAAGDAQARRIDAMLAQQPDVTVYWGANGTIAAMGDWPINGSRR